MNNNILYLLVATIFLGTGCANQTSPTGGPKDTIPPTLINSIPADQSINYDGTTIELTFNEYVRLNNARQQIILTPRIDQELTYTYRRNKAFIELERPLDPNTTYSINFREGIQDITENNPARAKLAFSTGDYIDSLEISGIVFDPLNGQPMEDVLVCLQEPIDTTYYFLNPALYFTRTAEDGTFHLTNLKVSDYHLYAFNDLNNDLTLQPNREKHGFIPKVISLTTDSLGFEIPMVSNNTDTLQVVSARQSGRYFDINFNKYVTQYSAGFSRDSLPNMLTEDHKTIRFFNLTNIPNNQPVRIIAEDSIDYQVDTQIPITYTESARNSYEFTMTTSAINILKTEPSINTSVIFNKPIDRIVRDSIYVFVDSTNILPFNPENYTLNKNRTELNITYPLDKKFYIQDEENPKRMQATYVYLGRGAFISVENDSSKQQRLTAKMNTPNQLGIINVKIEVTYDNFIVELLDNRNNVVQRHFNQHTIRYVNLSPGTYYLRVLEDADNDGIWDVGNIYANQPPDDIFYYINPENTRDVILRANWEIGPYTISN